MNALTSRPVFIVCNGTYGNTDFVEHTRRLVADGHTVHFVCRGPKAGVPVFPQITKIDAPQGLLGGLVFSFRAWQAIRTLVKAEGQPRLIHVMYYKGCAALGLLLGLKAVMDIRTGSVSSRKDELKNFVISLEAKFFSRVSVISESLARKLGLRDYQLLPIGCNVAPEAALRQSPRGASGEPVRFVYVGVLNGRHLDRFCASFLEFLQKSGANCRLDIYGYGTDEVLARVNAFCARTDRIAFHGYLDYNRQAELLAQCDVGVSYVPCTEHFHDQPPTKTYEYLANGLPVIATRTRENEKVMRDGVNGWLTGDDSAAVIATLDRIVLTLGAISTQNCIASVKSSQWSEIYKNCYSPLLSR